MTRILDAVYTLQKAAEDNNLFEEGHPTEIHLTAKQFNQFQRETRDLIATEQINITPAKGIFFNGTQIIVHADRPKRKY